MRKTFKTLLLALPLAMAGITAAQADNTSAEGRWRQIDPDTQRAKSIVEISRTSNGALHGRIVELLNPSRPNPTCDKCSDDRKDKPITGMEIIRGMRADGAGTHTAEASRAKAFTSASSRNPTSGIAKAIQSNPDAAGMAQIPGFLVLAGGVPVKIANDTIGAVGVAGAPGGHLDEACAQKALTAIKDQLQ